MKSKLADRECKEAPRNMVALKGKDLERFKRELGNAWKMVKKQRLEKQIKFKDFKGALAFTNRVGRIAEKQGHHPDIFLTYGEVRLQIWTHSAKGLTESDFVLAAKIGELPQAR